MIARLLKLLATGALFLSCFTIPGYGRDTVSPSDTLRNWGGPSVRTNLIWLAAAEPNLGLEIPVSDRFTVGGNFGLKPWPRFLPWDTDVVNNTKHWKNFAIVPEIRFWPDRNYEGFFTGLDLIYTHYNVGNVKFPFGLYPQVRDHRLQGDFYGVGLFAGYSWWLGNHWRLEAEAGLGAGYAKAGVYNCDHCSEQVGVHEGPALVPKLGLNIAYNVKRREKRQQIVEIIQALEKPIPPVLVEQPDSLVMAIAAVPDYMGRAGELTPHHPVLRPMRDYQPYTPDRILRKEEGALYVFFELDKSVLKRTFSEGGYSRDNGPVLDEIMDITAQILADTTSRVSCIQIIGLASIEGPVDRNVRLSSNRALALQKYIQERLPVKDELFELIKGGEAWTELRDQINDLYLAGGSEGLSQNDLRKVLEVLDSGADVNQKERQLKRLDGGKIYKVLLPTILHDQRNSGYVRIYFDYVPDEGARAINEAIETLESGATEEGLKKLEALRGDNRSDQAYAVALLRLGRTDEGVAVLREAAARGDEGCAALLKDYEEHVAREAAYQKYLKDLETYHDLEAAYELQEALKSNNLLTQ